MFFLLHYLGPVWLEYQPKGLMIGAVQNATFAKCGRKQALQMIS